MKTVLRTMKNWAHGHTVNNSKSRFGGIFLPKKTTIKNSNKKDKEDEEASKKGIITERYPNVHLNTQRCKNCHEEYHKDDARFCRICGTALH